MINRALTAQYMPPYGDSDIKHEYQLLLKVTKDHLRPTVCLPETHTRTRTRSLSLTLGGPHGVDV
jgi:hypothetical protein